MEMKNLFGTIRTRFEKRILEDTDFLILKLRFRKKI